MKSLKILLALSIILLSAKCVYAAKPIAKGATSQSITVVIKDADGDPNVSGLDITNLNLYSQRDGAYAMTDHGALAAHGAATDAWDDLEAYHMGGGLYRIDIPDAQLAYDMGDLITYVVVDTASHNQTAYYEVQLSPPVDAIAISGDPTAADNLEDLWDEDGIAANQKEIWVTDHATNYDGTLNVWNVDSEFFDGNDVTVDNVHEFFGKTSSVGAYENFEDFFDNTGLSVATFTTDGMTQDNIETYSQTGANAALVAMNLDHLLFLTTGVAADGDLEAFVSSGTVMAHLMGEAADVTVYKASTDAMSLGAASAASVADAVWDELSTGHVSAGKAGTQLWTDVDAIIIDTSVIGALGAGLTAVPWNSDWDAQVESEVEDAVGSDVTSILTYLGNETYGLSALESLVDDIGVAGAGLTAIEVEATATVDTDAVADAVLDGLTADHQTEGSLGWTVKRINDMVGLLR